MIQKAYRVAFPFTLVVVMVAFLSTNFLINANLSFASAVKKSLPVVASTSAVDHAEARIKQIQDTLKFTEAQGELWNNVTRVMRENAKEMDAITNDRVESTKTMNTVDHMELHSHITEAHLAQLKKFIPPFQTLYISMSDEQKKSTDNIFLRGKYGKSKRK